MSVPRGHPVFSVESSYGRCGHQHSQVHQARNCLRNMATRQRTAAWFHIWKWTRSKSAKDDDYPATSKLVERFENAGTCIECGSFLVRSADYEFGHHSDCPLVSN